MIEALALVIRKKEQLVFPNRAAYGATKHVPTESCTRQVFARTVEFVFPLVGIEFVVAEELPDSSMETVRARLDGSVDDAPCEIAELGGSIRSDQVEFLDCVRGGRETEIVFRGLIVIHPVQDEVIGLLTMTIDGRAATARRIVTIVEG